MDNSKLAQQIADKVARVKVEDDRIGGLYDYALKGAQAGLDREPEFAPDGVEDIFREYAEIVMSEDATDMHINFSAWIAPSLGVESPFGAGNGDTDLGWRPVTKEQARHILAYLSEQNRKDS